MEDDNNSDEAEVDVSVAFGKLAACADGALAGGCSDSRVKLELLGEAMVARIGRVSRRVTYRGCCSN